MLWRECGRLSVGVSLPTVGITAEAQKKTLKKCLI
jgi:hypothetical protein